MNFFNTVNLPSKELRFDHRGAKLRSWGRRFDQKGAEFVFCRGCHLTSLRPWLLASVFRSKWERLLCGKPCICEIERKPTTELGTEVLA